MDTGHGRKSDPADAHAVAVVGLRSPGLREVSLDDETVALKLMSERRRDLVRSRTQAMNRLHQILMQLIASGAPKQLTVAQATAWSRPCARVMQLVRPDVSSRSTSSTMSSSSTAISRPWRLGSARQSLRPRRT